MQLTRREFVKLSTAALAAMAVRRQSAAAKKPPPNLLMIVSDDQALEDLGCYGNATIQTPNLDRLASEGLRFTRAFTPTAICQPSRASLHTGLYATTNGAIGFTPVKPGIATLSATLKKANYRTALLGKTHLEPIEEFPFDVLKETAEFRNGRDVNAIAASAREFLQSCAAAKQPFFLNVNFDDPHFPWPLTKAEVDKRIDRFEKFHRQMDPRDRALGDVAGKHDPAKVRLPELLPDMPIIRRELARYCDAILRMDRGVGLLLALLDELKVANDTFVLFLSDNGMEFPFCKTTLWEGGVHMPLLARWPGVAPSGKAVEGFVSFVDVMPTLLELAQVAAPPKMEGRSFAAALVDPAAPLRDDVLLMHTKHRKEGEFPSRGLRTRRFKYLRNFWEPGTTFDTVGMDPDHDSWAACLVAAKSDPVLAERVERYLHRPPFELYDLDADPLEKKNLADDAKLADARAELHSRLKQQMAAIADPLTEKM